MDGVLQGRCTNKIDFEIFGTYGACVFRMTFEISVQI